MVIQPPRTPKQNHLPVLFGLSGIRVIEPTLYLYVADCPVDKDCDCSVMIEESESENQKWLRGQDGGRSNAQSVMRGSKGPEQEACPKCGHQFMAKRKAPAPETVTATVEKPTKNGDMVTLEQVKAVAQTVRAIGGFGRLNELLGLIRGVGGVRRFKDLSEAMSVTESVGTAV